MPNTDLPPDVDDVTAESAFDQLIAENPAVCHRCLRRLARYDEYPQEKGHQHHDVAANVEYTEPADAEGVAAMNAREYRIRTLEPARVEWDAPDAGDDPTDGERPECSACGTPWRCAAPSFGRPYPAERFREIVENLSRTLHEYGVDHDAAALRGTALELKTNSYESGHSDEKILRRATWAALSRPPDDGTTAKSLSD